MSPLKRSHTGNASGGKASKVRKITGFTRGAGTAYIRDDGSVHTRVVKSSNSSSIESRIRYLRPDGSVYTTTTHSPSKSRLVLLPEVNEAQSPLFPQDGPSIEQDPVLEGERREKVEPRKESKGDTQATKRLKEFLEELPVLTQCLLDHEYDADLGLPCDCGRGSRITKCQDCHNYGISCSECFIDRHRTSPFHWARVWSAEGYFRRCDFSTLREGGAPIHLGHVGGFCTNPSAPQTFIITHTNGVHATLVSFCRCFQQASTTKVKQLMASCLFPATVKEPKSAFSFSLLKQYDLHSLQAKISDYDWYHTLRRLTDNVFTSEVNDQYQAFMIVSRVWRYMNTRIRLGQDNNIDEYFPQRPPGSLILYCPACTDPGVNTQEKWWLTPEYLSHLIARRRTIDGNHQLNQFWKNFQASDFSLCDGNAQFPDTKGYLRFMENMGGQNAEDYSANCSHIKVIANQNRIRNQNCRKSGCVNIQCEHVFIEATTDMMHGEQFCVVDAALAHALRMTGFTQKRTDNHALSVPQWYSYDSGCQYCVKSGQRFHHEYLADVQSIVEKMGVIVPDVHIKGHQDDCNVLFSHSYMFCLGRFHGESAEVYWPESNQVGGFTRQMSDGHRADTIIWHHNDWGWKKTIHIDSLKEARSQYLGKRDYLHQLSIANKDQVPSWSRLNREPVQVNFGKTKVWTSPYHRKPGKVPSMKSLLHQIANAEEDISSTQGNKLDDISEMFRHGLEAEKAQLHIKELVRAGKAGCDKLGKLNEDETDSRRRKLADLLDKYRTHRAVVAPQVLKLVEQWQKSRKSGMEVEDEKLFLPSDIPEAMRIKLCLVELAAQEGALREAQLNEFIVKVKTVASSIGTMLQFRSKNEKNQIGKTRSEKEVANALSRRDRLITRYNKARDALISLKIIDPKDKMCRYPHMNVSDTHRLPVNLKRQTGDSRRGDGMLWRLGGAAELLAGVAVDENLPVGLDGDLYPVQLPTITQATQRQSSMAVGRKKQSDPSPGKLGSTYCQSGNAEQGGGEGEGLKGADHKLKSDGWVWEMGSRTSLNEQEMREWEEEGDCIQWMRGEAEMYRWMEQFESKHAELERVIAHFKKMADVWACIAESRRSEGHSAHALRQCAMYRGLAAKAIKDYHSVGHPDFIMRGSETTLSDCVVKWRIEQLRWMDELNIHRAYLEAKRSVRRLNPTSHST